ncbi:OLC1v1034830C1 [Oldenlandia corymbosa var. corymbosa]|uniref:OLC1v1034830C1 n=1 Tax=Oldenlandia corymbosa var. corymbosa TaxID=529605 RepID=A0AAV1CTA0_OLDCO|nr:OLC1v1034830C1 [Oldenlandia corymbosa var. corymbosa]
MDKRTLTMNWDGLGEDDDDDRFFESRDRLSSAIPLDLASSGSDDDADEFEDSRLSFVSSISSKSYTSSANNFHEVNAVANYPPILGDYGMWMAEPGDIKERRKRLLQGMGLASNKNLLKIASAKLVRAVSRKPETGHPAPAVKKESRPPAKDEPKQDSPDSSPILLVRSRSDGDIEAFSVNTKKRKEELIGPVSKQRLTRTSSLIITPNSGLCPYANNVKATPQKITCKSPNSGLLSSMFSDGGIGSFFLIKNLDTGKEFIVKEYNEQGMWNKLSDVETGKQLTMEEFEKSVGYSPVVKELMRRENVSRNLDDDNRKISANSYLRASFRNSKRRGVALLKNIRGVANSMSGLIADKEREAVPIPEQKARVKDSSQWVKVRQHGKSCKEFTALHLCQEIQAHEGSIWTVKFSTDARYLATAGEDRMIHIWEVQECEVASTKSQDEVNSASSTPVHPMAASAIADRPPLAEVTPRPSEKRKKGKHTSKKKGIPDYAHVPETVFALSEKPVCTFIGHQDDVLDLSWSRYQLLLSSSMDKTVRLWDMETKSCLKLFAHNDYVTCIDFNPVDDNYFISGSLDAKVRIWNIPDRYVVDWTDVHEMVTAACYTPDGQGAIIGSHKGSCRKYTLDDYKLEQKEVIEFQNKKKSQAKKVTGLQFAPWNSSEILVTSADSRIRILDGSEVIHKFRGFRNTSSQISAIFSPDGKYIISASEDNQVFIWRRGNSSGKGKSRVTTQSHEHFQCRDVSVAIPWPGSLKQDPPVVEMHSKRHSKRSSPLVSQSSGGSPKHEDANANGNSRRHLPPLPKKSNRAPDAISSIIEEDPGNSSPRIDPGIGVSESFGSASHSMGYNDSPSVSTSSNYHSQSWSSSLSFFDGGSSHGGQTVQATAWGSVIVAATLGGEIRVYQNFGLPFKVGRQTNLFRDLT